MKYCVFMFALVALIASNTTLADDNKWSFAIHPHPRKFEYSQLQQQIWQQAILSQGDDIEICDEVLRAEYDIYKLEYPAFVFSELALEPKMHRAWRDHLVKDFYHLPTQCMVNGAHARVLELLMHLDWVNVRFCGSLAAAPAATAMSPGSTRPQLAPLTLGDDYLAAGLEQMLNLAGLGVPEAMVNVLNYARMQPNLTLNPDVEYFLRMSLRRTFRFEEHWGVEQFKRHLSDKRLAFLELAVDRADLNAVRQTSPPCAAPLERPHPPVIIGMQGLKTAAEGKVRPFSTEN